MIIDRYFSPYVIHISGINISSILISLVVTSVVYLCLIRKNWGEFFIVTTTLSFVGACVGIAGGMSRVGVVGEVMPALLGLFGAISVYLFGIRSARSYIASFGAAAISIAVLAGYTISAEYRGKSDDHREIREICPKAYVDSDLLSNDIAFNRFNKILGKLCQRSIGYDLPPVEINSDVDIDTLGDKVN